MDNAATWIIAGMIIIPGLYLLVRSIRKEAVEGKCASCYMKDQCQTKECSGEDENSSSEEPKDEDQK